MIYQFKYNLVSETNENGLKTIKKFPLIYKVNNARSREEAIQIAKEALKGFYFDLSNPNEKKLLEIVDIERLPEKAPILQTNYFKFYVGILVKLRDKIDKGDFSNFELVGKQKDYYHSEFEYVLQAENGALIDILINKKTKEMKLSINGTTIYFQGEDKDISVVCKPFLLGQKSDFEEKIEFRYFYNRSRDYEREMSCGVIRENHALSNTAAIDDMPKKFNDLNSVLAYSLKSFTRAMPEFSAREIAKKQKVIQEEFERQFNESQKRICDEENSAFRSKFIDKPNKNEVFDFAR